jgi:hypothetical protein
VRALQRLRDDGSVILQYRLLDKVSQLVIERYDSVG